MAFTFIGALVVGLILGLLGSGGSVTLVPILIYVVGHDAKVSIAESMAIAGAISAVGAIPFARAKSVDWSSVVYFGLPAMAGTFLGAWLGGLASDKVQLTVFGVVLLLAAVIMTKKAFGKQSAENETGTNQIPVDKRKISSSAIGLIVVEGIVVGAVTGFVGVGGGFLIVPALLILGKLPMRTAIGTSLVIIALKSVVGFLKYQQFLSQHSLYVDWATIGVFVAIGIGGCLIGQQLNTRLNQRTLKQAFTAFLILIGSFVIIREVGGLSSPGSEGPSTSLSQPLGTSSASSQTNDKTIITEFE